MTNQPEHKDYFCRQHQDNMVEAAVMKSEVKMLKDHTEKLFAKVEANGEILHDIQRCVKGINIKFDAFEKHYEERVDLYDTIIAEYRQAMISIGAKFEDIGKKLAEYGQFDWFRSKVTWARDNLLWLILIIVVLGVVGLLIVHTASEGFVSLLVKLLGAGK